VTGGRVGRCAIINFAFFVKRYLREYNRSDVETLDVVGRLMSIVNPDTEPGPGTLDTNPDRHQVAFIPTSGMYLESRDGMGVGRPLKLGML